MSGSNNKIKDLLGMLQDSLAKSKIISDNLAFEISSKEYNLSPQLSSKKLLAAFGCIEKLSKTTVELSALLEEAKRLLK
jgi:hypothetical protein